jgi:hypothetical protein
MFKKAVDKGESAWYHKIVVDTATEGQRKKLKKDVDKLTKM